MLCLRRRRNYFYTYLRGACFVARVQYNREVDGQTKWSIITVGVQIFVIGALLFIKIIKPRPTRRRYYIKRTSGAQTAPPRPTQTTSTSTFRTAAPGHYIKRQQARDNKVCIAPSAGTKIEKKCHRPSPFPKKLFCAHRSWDRSNGTLPGSRVCITHAKHTRARSTTSHLLCTQRRDGSARLETRRLDAGRGEGADRERRRT